MQTCISFSVLANSAASAPKNANQNIRATATVSRALASVPHSHAFVSRPSPAHAQRHPSVCASAVPVSFEEAAQIPATGSVPGVAGVYAVFDPQGTLQFLGVSRKVAVSVATHLEALPELVGSVKVLEMPNAGKEELQEAWKEWIQEAG